MRTEAGFAQDIYAKMDLAGIKAGGSAGQNKERPRPICRPELNSLLA